MARPSKYPPELRERAAQGWNRIGRAPSASVAAVLGIAMPLWAC